MKKVIILSFMVAAMALPVSAGLFSAKGDSPEEKRAVVRQDRDEILAKLYAAQPEAKEKIQKAAGYGTFNNKNLNLFLLSSGHGYGVVVDKNGKETFMAMGYSSMLENSRSNGKSIRTPRILSVLYGAEKQISFFSAPAVNSPANMPTKYSRRYIAILASGLVSVAQGYLFTFGRLVIAVLGTGMITAMVAAAGFTKGREIAPLTPQFKPGDYVWKPEISPAGPVVIIVSIPEQEMLVYRNGVRIGRSTVSTGAEGHPTPTGIFTILQKKEDHESSIYKGAKMPYMQRLTWDGIAMHAGHLPGYPASHGCVRLPEDFAAKLYTVTTNGTTVVVTDQKNTPGKTANPGLLLSGKTGGATTGRLPSSGFEWQPTNSTSGAVSIIFSLPDAIAYVYRNGVQIGRCTFAFNRQQPGIRGSHVYSALARVDAQGRRDWLAITSIGGGKAPEVRSLAARTVIPTEFIQKVRALITPGTTLILTDLPVSSQTHSDKNFRILTTETSR